MEALFFSVAIPSGNSSCKVPCTRSRFTTRRFIKTPLPYTSLHITFDQKIAVARSRFSINEQTFLTKVGGFIGVGRTSLWILVSLLGASQVVSDKNLLTLKKTYIDQNIFQVVRKLKSLKLGTACRASKEDNDESTDGNMT